MWFRFCLSRRYRDFGAEGFDVFFVFSRLFFLSGVVITFVFGINVVNFSCLWLNYLLACLGAKGSLCFGEGRGREWWF